jgi:CheY-like chemotaxis protein
MIENSTPEFLDKFDQIALNVADVLSNKARILIGDDDRISLKLLVGLLKRNYILKQAESGKQALEMIQSTRPDPVRCDDA